MARTDAALTYLKARDPRWTLEETGGGCTAFVLRVTDTEFLLTIAEGALAPVEIDQPVYLTRRSTPPPSRRAPRRRGHRWWCPTFDAALAEVDAYLRLEV